MNEINSKYVLIAHMGGGPGGNKWKIKSVEKMLKE